MTFSTKIKDELSLINFDPILSRILLASYCFINGKIDKSSVTFVIENAKVARRIYKCLKELYNINIYITIRNQKRFRVKQIYILKIVDKIDEIDLDLISAKKSILSNEEKIAYLVGAFLATGNISNPSTSGYHFEISVYKKEEAKFLDGILKDFNLPSKIIKREKGYMIYIKSAEAISDILKMFNAINSLFYFEDIRIYRDHKNMVNRLNNCEIANQEKIINTGLRQIEDIKYLKSYDLISLLDDKTKIVLEYRLSYPESSYLELADIISLETDYKIGKSGINHHFIKIRKLKEKHENNKSK